LPACLPAPFSSRSVCLQPLAADLIASAHPQWVCLPAHACSCSSLPAPSSSGSICLHPLTVGLFACRSWTVLCVHGAWPLCLARHPESALSAHSKPCPRTRASAAAAGIVVHKRGGSVLPTAAARPRVLPTPGCHPRAHGWSHPRGNTCATPPRATMWPHPRTPTWSCPRRTTYNTLTCSHLATPKCKQPCACAWGAPSASGP